jgi:hypothetical protein
MNAPFLDRQGWETGVNKMVTVFGAPIGPTDTKIIVDYLVTNYRHRQLNAFDAKRVDVNPQGLHP